MCNAQQYILLYNIITHVYIFIWYYIIYIYIWFYIKYTCNLSLSLFVYIHTYIYIYMCTHSIILFNNIHKGLFHGNQKTWAQTIHSWCIERTSRYGSRCCTGFSARRSPGIRIISTSSTAMSPRNAGVSQGRTMLEEVLTLFRGGSRAMSLPRVLLMCYVAPSFFWAKLEPVTLW